MKLKQHDPKVGTQPKFEHSFPLDFVLVIDTRENDNLFKRPPKGLVIVRDTLSAGDYSIKGFETNIAVERKNLSDLYGSLGKNRDRFKNELDLLRYYERKWLMIEGLEDEVLCYQEYSQLHPNSVRGALASIEIRYGIPVVYCDGRKQMERKILDLFVKYYNVKRE